MPPKPALQIPAPDAHVGNGRPALVVEADTEEFGSARESADAAEGNACTDTVSPSRSLKKLTTASNASFFADQNQPDFNLPPQEEANISSQYTNKFASFTKFLNESKKHISTNAKKDVILNGRAISRAIFQTSCGHSIRGINL